MQTVSKFIPASYVFEGMRSVVLGNLAENLYSTLAIASILSLIYLVLASYFFNSVYKYARRTGLISKMDAEAF